MKAIIDYFEQLAIYSQSLLDRLPMQGQIYPLDYVLNDLHHCLKNIKKDETDSIRLMWPRCKKKMNLKNVHAGMNTIGMLTDRLTILIIKEWHLRQDKQNGKAGELYHTQTKDVIECLARCTPAKSVINAKITTHTKVDFEADDWEDAYYGLLAVNLIMWKSQETLYIKDIEGLPCEELRAHIRWFSRGNVERNILIERCEKKYWEKLYRDEKSVCQRMF